jgi:endonuclease/exonuclease/phosphatase (EEP) superfamily protein YafD
VLRLVDRLLLFATALLVLAHLAPLGARLSWVVDLTTHFRVQYLVATLVLLPLLALRRRLGAFLALLATGALSAAPVAPYLPLAAPAVAAGSARIKILTVNVSFRQFSANDLLDLVRAADPDVLITQELTPYAEKVLAELDEQFAHGFKLPADGPSGIGLWSRLELERVAPFALARMPAIEARVRAPAGGTFTVLGVHLSAPTSGRRAGARNAQLRELAERAAAVDGPLLIAGDFNVTPYSPYFTEWLAETGLTDSRRGRTLSVSWPTTMPLFGIPIDHVVANDGFTFVAHRRLPNFRSDHYGVLVEVALRAGATAQ